MGRSFYDAAVADLIRAMATESSWSAAAGAINEMMEAAWKREVQTPYAHLCQAMNLNVLHGQCEVPRELRMIYKCVKSIYMEDFAVRHDGLEERFRQRAW